MWAKRWKRVPKAEKVWQKLRKCAKNWESMWKCAKSRKSVSNIEEVCQKLRKCAKIWEIVLKLRKLRKCAKSWEVCINYEKGANCYFLQYKCFFWCAVKKFGVYHNFFSRHCKFFYHSVQSFLACSTKFCCKFCCLIEGVLVFFGVQYLKF